MRSGTINSIIIPSSTKIMMIGPGICLFFLLAIAPGYADATFGADIFGLGRLVARETKPLYTVKDSGIQMDFRASTDKYQELIAINITSSYGTIGPIVFSSAFYPFSPQYLIVGDVLVILGGETLIVIEFKSNNYQIVPVRATLMFLAGEKVYLESPDQWGQGYDLKTRKRIGIYSAKNREYKPKSAIAAKRIEKDGKVVEQKEAWKVIGNTNDEMKM